MNPEEMRELLSELMQAIQAVMQSGEVLSDEFQAALASTLDNLMTRIDESSQAPKDQGGAPSTGPVGNPPSPDAQLLWILAGQDEQAFLQYLTTYPTNETQALLRNPTELERVVSFLTQMMPPGEPLVVDGIPHAGLNSSNVWGMAYNPSNRQMKVRFQSGAEYVYEGIPPNIYRAFSQGEASAKTTGSNEYGAWWTGKNPSLGAALNQYIKAGGFPYQRIN